MSKKKKQAIPVKTPQRPIDRYIETFNQSHQHPLNGLLTWIGIPLFAFSILGLVWVIPFPEIGFLKRYGYDTFINWASIYIAVIIYAYLRLSATLSYAMLLTIGIYSFFIVQLEYWADAGGPSVYLVCSVLLSVSIVLLFIGSRAEGRAVNFVFLALAPIWLWHFVFKRFHIPY